MKRWVLVLVIGIGFLVVTLLFSRKDPNLIKCGGRIMSPGDVCETTKNGRTTGEDTYAEMKAAAESRAETFREHGLWMAGVGVALTGLGATMLVRGKRRAARAGVTAPQGGQPLSQAQPQWQQQWQGQPQPGFPPQQQYQRQPQPVQQYPQQGGWPRQPPPQQPQQFGPTGH
ncbi:hypothetical protein [Amycolatopsis regifaucium]|uniref:Uncharacterized protein n=1 Tax=Amycolatopsis regifaucium TaxID=546365 RepID=A0A154MSM3_9PSEU|nr:hypothetical protein [Amycolatopsis regifaucium]KZB87328.1 hypothetical protein AVL48_21995 [Amycolatopsis regifaucium]OKA08162.1 hypothetical protein ATP06_0212755 [Amycolatopsis regifaucium]SFI41762.1 hypothetical protein SAMN04489731_110215 [Amycolatopsis regifaucium]